LDETTTPGDNLAAGTSYVLAQDSYPLPTDFRSLIALNWQAGTYNPAYVDIEEFAMLATLITGPAAPTYYTIYGDRSLLGTKDIRFYPSPDQAYPTNLYYNGGGRPLAIEYYRSGNVTTTASSRTVTGSGTSWTSAMIGSVIRFAAADTKDSSGNTIYPTGVDGLYPPVMEHVITGVASATSLTIDTAADLSLAATAYQISDPIDMPDWMFNFFYRSIDKQARLSMRSKDIGPSETNEYMMAFQEACEADSVFGGTRVARLSSGRPRLLREYPINVNG
jgi:hypothetical protein